MAPCLLPKISRVEVTPSVTSMESSEQFWRKLRQLWRICEPCHLQLVVKGVGELLMSAQMFNNG